MTPEEETNTFSRSLNRVENAEKRKLLRGSLLKIAPIVTFAFIFINCIHCPDLTNWPNTLEHLQNVQLLEKWGNKSLVSMAHWTDPWQFENSLGPLLFADFDEFLLHQAAQIQIDALLIYRMTWYV